MGQDTRPYITVTNELFGHPKFKRLTPAARLYLLELWAHCNMYMTDGVLEAVTLFERGKKIGNELINGGWVEAHEDGSYSCHDYLEHQKSREQILKHREDKKGSGEYGSHVRWHVKRGVHDLNCEHCQKQRAG